MKTVRDIGHIEGVKALVRADFNVPVKNGKVADDFRIRSALPTIDFLSSRGAKVILMSHIKASEGEVKTGKEGPPSLQPVAVHMNKMGKKVVFVKDYAKARQAIDKMKDGEVILLENIRSFPGEEGNDAKFAAELASLGDIYVNEAFSASHREHASMVGVPKLMPSYAGLELEKEVTNLSRCFTPPHPFLFLLGGAKFSTKLPLLEKFIGIADTVFIGGALANDVFKEKGYEVGQSLISKDGFNLSRFINDEKVLIPADVVNQNHESKPPDALSADDKILDDGPKTLDMLKDKVASAKFILWNGPLGMYEGGYKEGTLGLAKMVAEAAERGAETIVGGGDTLAAIAELGLEDKLTFISTAGGAMLEFLAKGTLPGIEALETSNS